MPRKTKEGDSENSKSDRDLDDLEEHAYYYDDAHGYQEYDPEIVDEDSEEEDHPAAGR